MKSWKTLNSKVYRALHIKVGGFETGRNFLQWENNNIKFWFDKRQCMLHSLDFETVGLWPLDEFLPSQLSLLRGCKNFLFGPWLLEVGVRCYPSQHFVIGTARVALNLLLLHGYVILHLAVVSRSCTRPRTTWSASSAWVAVAGTLVTYEVNQVKPKRNNKNAKARGKNERTLLHSPRSTIKNAISFDIFLNDRMLCNETECLFQTQAKLCMWVKNKTSRKCKK